MGQLGRRVTGAEELILNDSVFPFLVKHAFNGDSPPPFRITAMQSIETISSSSGSDLLTPQVIYGRGQNMKTHL